MKCLAPWELFEDNAEAAEQELARELCSEHILYNIQATAIAYRCDCDDVLFKLSGFTHEYAVVHLTYSKETDYVFPRTELYENIKEWESRCMMLDHDEYTY